MNIKTNEEHRGEDGWDPPRQDLHPRLCCWSSPLSQGRAAAHGGFRRRLNILAFSGCFCGFLAVLSAEVGVLPWSRSPALAQHGVAQWPGRSATPVSPP